jgi:hypothetical protein
VADDVADDVIKAALCWFDRDVGHREGFAGDVGASERVELIDGDPHERAAIAPENGST